MMKTFVLLFCLSVTLGAGYSASNGTTPTTATTAAPPTTGNKSTPTTATTAAPPTTGNKSTTATATTSTPAPPIQPPGPGNFSLKKNGTKTYCLLAQFAVTFTIHYLAEVRKDNSSKTMEKNATIFLNGDNSHDVNIGGVCGENKTEQKLILSWPKNNSYYTLTMEFSEMAKAVEANKQSGKQWRVQMIYLHIKMDGNPTFPNATEKKFTSVYNGSSGSLYDVGGYYSCESEDKNEKFEAPNNYTVAPVFEDVKLEPFVTKNTSDQFGNERFSCYQDNPTSASKPTPTKSANNDIVPIAVGCALAGLVLIVLIAYIIGRRKSHRGYEKV